MTSNQKSLIQRVLVKGYIYSSSNFYIFFLARPPSREWPPPRATSVSCTYKAKVYHKTTARRLSGIGRPSSKLRISGSGHGPLRVTLQSILYSSGTIVLSAIPCVGNVAIPWWIVSAVLMVKESHNISGIRATFAVLTGPVVAMVLFIALYMLMIVAAFSAMPGTAVTQFRTQSTETVLAVLIEYADANGGRGPAHALELVLDPGLREQDFIDPFSATIPADVPVGATTLADLAFNGPDDRAAVIEQAAAALPDGVVAHRVGDFVFTYHGAVLDGRAPGLWLVVLSPDPDTLQVPGSDKAVVVGRADGTTLQLSSTGFPDRLEQQNRLRAGQGLPPLPLPSTVTHQSPAVAEP